MTMTSKEQEETGVVGAARLLKVMPDQVYGLIWGERLKAKKINGRWRIDIESVRERLAALKNRENSSSK